MLPRTEEGANPARGSERQTALDYGVTGYSSGIEALLLHRLLLLIWAARAWRASQMLIIEFTFYNVC